MDNYITPEVITSAPIPGTTDSEVTTSSPTSNDNSVPLKIGGIDFPQRKLATDLINESLNTRSKQILGTYSFGQLGALKIGKYESGVSGEITISPDGIVATNSSGVVTFALDGATGSATFKGEILAGSIISAQLTIDGNASFGAGYDPTTKVDEVGGNYASASSGARVRIFPDSNTGIIAYTSDGTTVVFKIEVGGTNVGDVTIGNYGGGVGMLWDQSAGTLNIKGDMTAGNITGVNIATASSGTRVAMTSSSDSVNWYDSGNDIGMTLNLESTTGAVIEAKDSRSVVLKASSGYINFNDHILRDLKFIEFNQKSSRPSDNDGIWYYVSSGGGSYEFRSRMEGGNWKFDQTGV